LDLYAGTGSLGLEALSRGAEWVDFVEFSNKAIAVLINNITKLRCSEQCHVHKRRVESFLVADGMRRYDLILLDPPYGRSLVNRTLTSIYDHLWLADEGLIVVEHAPQEVISERFQGLIISSRSTKTTTISILRST